ncbi:hypothetical protein NL676_023992 [Syzygium grande]|nr:hypothetical protein NL676_023992 [Syzygium grande]
MIKVALLCTNATPTLRPVMSSVVSMLERKVAVTELDSEGTIKTEEKIEAMGKHFKGDKDQAVCENITNSMFTEGPSDGIASLPSANDLFPIPLDTDYFQNIE